VRNLALKTKDAMNDDILTINVFFDEISG